MNIKMHLDDAEVLYILRKHLEKEYSIDRTHEVKFEGVNDVTITISKNSSIQVTTESIPPFTSFTSLANHIEESDDD
jgi:hypothetical protein